MKMGFIMNSDGNNLRFGINLRKTRVNNIFTNIFSLLSLLSFRSKAHHGWTSSPRVRKCNFNFIFLYHNLNFELDPCPGYLPALLWVLRPHWVGRWTCWIRAGQPKFLLKKSMINVFSHLPQQVTHWKGLSRGFLHWGVKKKKKKNHRARQIHECLLAPGKPSRLEICQRAFSGSLPVFCSGETLCGGTSFALVKAN